MEVQPVLNISVKSDFITQTGLTFNFRVTTQCLTYTHRNKFHRTSKFCTLDYFSSFYYVNQDNFLKADWTEYC